MKALSAPKFNFDVDEDEYLNKHALAPQLPFRLLIYGQTGSGKTNFLLNLIYHYLHYNKVYMYAKHLSEKKYESLQEFFDKVHEKLEKKYKEPIEIGHFSSNKSDIVQVDDLDKEYQNLIIYDDFVTEKDEDLIIDFFIKGRKKNVSVIYLIQSYFSTPKDIRLQCGY
jgi:predicted ATPase